MLKNSKPQPLDLAFVELSGFKSIAKKTKIKFAPLTIFSGANSAGKSSVSQAILLLKQTSEAAYDPGAILLNGPNVKLTSARHLLSQLPGLVARRFVIKFEFNNGSSTELSYKSSPEKAGGLDIEFIKETSPDGSSARVSSSSGRSDLLNAVVFSLPVAMREGYAALLEKQRLTATRTKCFYTLASNFPSKQINFVHTEFGFKSNRKFLNELIHVPGLRGNPERTYATTATTSGSFPGRFEPYVASLVRNWEHEDKPKFRRLTQDLIALGLTSEIRTAKIDDTQVELKVSRIKSPGSASHKDHLVSIADVGFGVSQVLPILVALHAAEQGQYVMVEQPELHLHPKAQSKLAAVLVAAINRGVRVIIETHSNILIQGMQTLVAQGALPHDSVALNWFATTPEGYTRVTRGEMDGIGAFGSWPADFMDVQLESENAYLSAVEEKMFPGSPE